MSEPNTTRRSVLKAAGSAAGAATLTAAAGPAAATPEQQKEALDLRESVPDRFADTDLTAELEREAEPVLAELADEGHIEAPSLEAFDDELPDDRSERAALARDGVAVDATFDMAAEAATPTLWSRADLDDGEILLQASPDGSAPFALVRSDEETTVVKPDLDASDVVADQDCDPCQTRCGPWYVVLEGPAENCGSCGNRSPTCDECPDMSKCNGW